MKRKLGAILLVVALALSLGLVPAVSVSAAMTTQTIVSDANTQYWSWGSDSTWGTGDETWEDAVPCWTHGSWVSIAPVGATWIWTSSQINPLTEYNTLPPEGYRTFKRTFEIPASAYNITGSISINADNAYVLLVNGVVVDSEGAMGNPLVGPDNHEWSTLRTTTLTNLVVGTNTIEVHALNYLNTGSGTSNPAALVFSLTTEYEEPEPLVTNLCAGQDIDIGNTIVENDGTNLYVTYEITVEGWLLVETHLEVVEDKGDFPTTKKGNPKVGHFTWSNDHSPPVDTFTYTIPLVDIGDGVATGDPVYIAAHAAVVKITGDGITEFWASNVDGDNTDQGLQWDGVTPVAPDRSDTGDALGPPDASPSPSWHGFYSLGFEGWLTVQFDSPIFNGPGDEDISVHEVSGNRGYPPETADVYIVVGDSEILVGSVSSEGTGVGYVAIPDEYVYVDAVKIVDTTDKSIHTAGDGYDVDAVDAYYLVEQEETAWGGACDSENYWSDPDNLEGFVYFFNPDGKGNWASYFTYHVQ